MLILLIGFYMENLMCVNPVHRGMSTGAAISAALGLLEGLKSTGSRIMVFTC